MPLSAGRLPSTKTILGKPGRSKRVAIPVPTVIITGKPVTASTTLAVACVGKKIQTIEGLVGNHPDVVSRAFVQHDAQQCGFCTLGFVVAVRAFLNKHPKATEAEIRQGLNGNICRCGTYANIIQATFAWKDGKLTAYLSTQNVSGTDDGFANALKITSDDVEVKCDYIGGGFGSKFAPNFRPKARSTAKFAGVRTVGTFAPVTAAAGLAAVAGASPLAGNQYKVRLAQVAVSRAILLAAGLETGGF